MNRKILVLLVLIGIFAVIAVTGYAVATGVFETESEIDSEVSEAVSEVSEVKSEQIFETKSEETLKDPTEGVETEVPEVTDTTDVEGDPESDYDDNGVPRDESTYLDDDGDTIANFYDICPGVDDFSDECDTDAYDTAETATVETVEAAVDDTSTEQSEYDSNGDVRADSKYLDDDEDTIANFYDICPGVDDFSSDCDTDAYN